MVHPSVEAGLMKGIRHAAARASCAATAAAAAVALASIARLADREWHPAPAAQQQVQDDRRHHALAHVIRPREEWTGERGGAILLPLTSSRPAPTALHRRGFFFRGRDDTSHQPNRRRGFAADDDGTVSRSNARQDSAVLDRRSHKAVFLSRGMSADTSVYDVKKRPEWLKQLSSPHRELAEWLGKQLDQVEPLRDEAQRWLLTEAKRHPIIRKLATAPGMGPIRTAQVVAHNPHRLSRGEQCSTTRPGEYYHSPLHELARAVSS